MVRFDILKYLMVIWDPMKVLGAKQGVIMSHWGPVGVITRSVGVSETQWGLIGAQWGLLGVKGSVHNAYTPESIVLFWKNRISSNKCWASNKCRLLINATLLGIQIEINASL